MARIHVVTEYPGIIDNPVLCRQCKNPPCATICPVEALSVDKNTKAVLVDAETCTGCELCVNECPYGAITISVKKKVAVICDLCGGEPACVTWCPFDAIEITIP